MFRQKTLEKFSGTNIFSANTSATSIQPLTHPIVELQTTSKRSRIINQKLSLTNNQIRQGEFINSSRRIDQLVKEFSSKDEGLF